MVFHEERLWYILIDAGWRMELAGPLCYGLITPRPVDENGSEGLFVNLDYPPIHDGIFL